jgi:hypothetical protein
LRSIAANYGAPNLQLQTTVPIAYDRRNGGGEVSHQTADTVDGKDQIGFELGAITT